VKRAVQRTLIRVLCFSVAVVNCSGGAFADGASPTPSTAAPNMHPDLARRIGEITDAVLAHHIDPPVRQQMILGGVKALYHASGVPIPAGLSLRVSSLVTCEQIEAFLTEAWPKLTSKPLKAAELEEALLGGLLGSVSGGARLVSAKERKVEEQLEGNRYVGIHIAVRADEKEKLTSISEVFEGGPADRAGVKKDDVIEQVDGVATKGMAIGEVIDRLRGDEGTEVTITVRQPGATTARTMKITRGQLPHPTITSVRKQPSGDWDVRLGGVDPVGYLKITEIASSTPHELRKMAARLQSQGARALIIDLRGPTMHAKAVHPAVLLADCLLERGPIGRVRTAQGEVTYQADSDAVFRGWPIVALVDPSTSGTAEWLAAALQDNRRAVIVGAPTGGAGRIMPTFGDAVELSADVRSRVPVGDGSWSIELTTGRLVRGDGRLLSRPADGATAVVNQRIMRRRDMLEEAKTGVQPDHVVGQPKAPGGPYRLPAAQEYNLSTDAMIQKAVQLLRESLKAAETRVSA
jgi:carboxyl-terminal processing protease